MRMEEHDRRIPYPSRNNTSVTASSYIALRNRLFKYSVIERFILIFLVFFNYSQFGFLLFRMVLSDQVISRIPIHHDSSLLSVLSLIIGFVMVSSLGLPLKWLKLIAIGIASLTIFFLLWLRSMPTSIADWSNLTFLRSEFATSSMILIVLCIWVICFLLRDINYLKRIQGDSHERQAVSEV
jgi:hypothetical protein